MKKVIAFVAVASLPTLLHAQSQEEADTGYLATLIQDNLSGASRDVNIYGFKGALSSEASIDRLTIADAEGVWLTLEGVVLDWNRSALLRGRIDVTQLSAKRIVVERAPLTEASAPSPEASAFALPELPVSIQIGELLIDDIQLGESFLGEKVNLTLSGTAALAGGEGSAEIKATRLGNKFGQFDINGSFNNETSVLALLLDLEEGQNGLAATLLDLPGGPSVKLAIDGTGPINDYSAEIALATDGQDRIAGNFAQLVDAESRLVTLNVGGDVTPLFAPEYQAFFGSDISLDVAARIANNGPISLEAFDLVANEVQLSGRAEIAAQGWPERLEIKGQIKGDGSDLVLLPLAGPKTYVNGATIDITYDGAVSDDWTADISVAGFDRPGLFIQDLTLDGGGILKSGEGSSVGEVTADLSYIAGGITLDDTGASQALGEAISGVITAAHTEGSPTKITNFTMTGPGLEAQADAVIEGADPGFRMQSNLVLTVEALDRFSALAGRDLAGAADLAIASTIIPLDGLFDAVLTGTTQDLAVGIAQLDAVFAGAGTISAATKRDETGTRLDGLRIETNAAALTANANITSTQSSGTFALSVADVAVIEPTLSGPIAVSGDATRAPDGTVRADIKGTDRASQLALNALVAPLPAGQVITYQAEIDTTDAAHYARLLGRDLAGAVDLALNGTVKNNGADIVATVAATTSDLRVGVPQLTPLLAGNGQLKADLFRVSSDEFVVKDLILTTPQATVTADGFGGLTGVASLDLDARINDMAVLGQGLRGPLTATIDGKRDQANNATLDAALRGDGTTIDLDADIDPNLKISGVLTADLDNLAGYRALVGQPISGALSARIAGDLTPDLSSFDANVSAQSRNLGIGNPIADVLLAGDGRLSAQARLADGALAVSELSFSTPNLTANADLGGQSGAGRGSFRATLRDVGVLTDQLNGPLTANGTAALDNAGTWDIDATAVGPGGMSVQTAGQYSRSGQLNLTANGKAPLGLANNLLEPRRLSGDATFNLAINGQPRLEALTGRIDLSDARLAAPTLGQALDNIRGGAAFANGTATLNVSADVQSGGGVSVSGPVALTSPQVADIAINLDRVILKDPELYQTSISGNVAVRGPLQGGAQISGRLDLGQTDIQVPSSGVGALGDLPNVQHIGANAQVLNTLSKAGITASGETASVATTSGPNYPLDVTISAPSRIFIRGRGLDAELGGTLRIGGTTQNVQPVGLFELERGRIDILQQRFELTEGSASLQGSFEPYIRLVATTEARTGTTISIIVEGPASEPEVKFVSVPDLPQDEVLSQLIFGRDLESISPLQAVQLAAAVGTLAGKGGGGLIDNFRQGIGLDDFDVTTDEEGNAAVRAGKYLSDNVYTDVTVSSDGSTEINLNLDITDQITAKGTVDADGETSIGVFFERDY